MPKEVLKKVMEYTEEEKFILEIFFYALESSDDKLMDKLKHLVKKYYGYNIQDASLEKGGKRNG